MQFVFFRFAWCGCGFASLNEIDLFICHEFTWFLNSCDIFLTFFSVRLVNGFGVSVKDFLKTLKVVVEFELIIKVSQVRMTFGTCVVAIVFNQTFPLCNI